MAAMDYDGEITELKRRMDEMEREVDGEKMLSRHIFQKVQANERLLLEVRNDVSTLRIDIDAIRKDVDVIRADLNEVKTEVALIRAELPGLMADAVVQAIRVLAH